MKSSFLPIALVLAAAPALGAEPMVDLTAIDQAIESFTGNPIGAAGGAIAPIDRRLRLAPCSNVAMSWRTPRHDTLVLQCRTGTGWRLFVPVAVAGPRPGAGAGWSDGSPDANAQGIARGDIVTIQVKGAGFSVSQSGEAVEPGAVGSWIKIKLPGKSDILTAQVVRPGLVELPAI